VSRLCHGIMGFAMGFSGKPMTKLFNVDNRLRALHGDHGDFLLLSFRKKKDVGGIEVIRSSRRSLCQEPYVPHAERLSICRSCLNLSWDSPGNPMFRP
jgi:hypothetical protein